MSRISDRIRHEFRAGDTIRDTGLVTPQDIVRQDDIVYGSDPIWQALDIYRPKSVGQTPLPVIVHVHGGGWVYGDKHCYQYYCMALAQRGFAVVNFSYRLAPEHRFPTQLEDIQAAFSWVLAHSAEYCFDLRHVFGAGDSAGAHLLALYVGRTIHTSGFVPQALGLNCGIYRPDPHRSDLTGEMVNELLPKGWSKPQLAQLDVTTQITSDFPPVFLMTSTGDFLRDQSFLLRDVLAAKQIPCVFRLYGSEANQLPHVFHCNIRTKDAIQCGDEMCAFFNNFNDKEE